MEEFLAAVVWIAIASVLGYSWWRVKIARFRRSVVRWERPKGIRMTRAVKEAWANQIDEVVKSKLDQNETVLISAAAVRAAHPMIPFILDDIVRWALEPNYLVSLTDRRLILFEYSGKRALFKSADPRTELKLLRVKHGLTWTRLTIRRPGGKKLRLKFHRNWRAEAQSIAQALPTFQKERRASRIENKGA